MGEPLLDHTGEPPEPEWAYGRVPLSVLADTRLKHYDVRVFAAISSPVWQGNYSSMGTRRISELAGVSRRLSLQSIKRLIEYGHMVPTVAGKGKRAGYIMTSKVFGQKQRDGVKEVGIGPSGGRRLVSAPKSARIA